MKTTYVAGIRLIAAAVGVALCSSPVWAGRYDTDRPGGQDHPMISRYTGSLLYHYGDDPLGVAQIVELAKGQPVTRGVEGRISNRLYWGPKGRSSLEVFRNYQQALQAAGFQTMFSCELAQCEKLRIQNMVERFPRTAKWIEYDGFAEGTFDSASQPGFHYISARKRSATGFSYIQVALADTRGDGPSEGRARQFVQIVEPAQAQMGQVTVDAKAIGELLQRDGKIALYGVQFDTNKAVLRADSTAQLQSMAQALKASPALKVFIVGHTDNQGELEANLALSQKRAQAVADALSSKFGIAAARLSARGVANMAPVSSNASEEGRAKNRRVELVVR